MANDVKAIPPLSPFKPPAIAPPVVVNTPPGPVTKPVAPIPAPIPAPVTVEAVTNSTP